jgi:hypothetical protein
VAGVIDGAVDATATVVTGPDVIALVALRLAVFTVAAG